MNNNLLRLKIKQRTNKLGSNDFDLFEDWMVVEAFNKVQNEWVRDAATKAEIDTQNVDDLQKVTKEITLSGLNHPRYFESADLPGDYFAGKRVSASATTPDCKTPRSMMIYPGEEANRDSLLRDPNKNPSFLWAETFRTMIDNKIRIYTNGEFSIQDASLVYYRKPRQISFEGGVNEYDETTSDVECEFKDDLVEKLIDKTAALLSGDVENFNQVQRLQVNNP